MTQIDTYANKDEIRKPAPPETFMLSITGDEGWLIINVLDLYSRIWIGQYERIDDISIYKTDSKWDVSTERHIFFQQIRDILIPSLAGVGDYTSCSLGIWSENTDIRAINAYDIQQRLRYELSWFKNPGGGWTVNYGTPLIKGNHGDLTVFCEEHKGRIKAYLYLSQDQLLTIRTSLEVYRFLVKRDFRAAFSYFTSDQEALTLSEKVTQIYKQYGFLSFESDKNFGQEHFDALLNGISLLITSIQETLDLKDYAEYIRINIPPANAFVSTEEIIKILDQPFEHFRRYRRKYPPQDVSKMPGAGFLTKMSGKEHSTTDYMLVWYDAKSRTEYYYVGESFVFKHEGRLDLPEDIKLFIREKCRKKLR